VAHYQNYILTWISNESALTGTVLFAAGLLFGFYSFRMLRFVIAVFCAGVGYALGGTLAEVLQIPPASVQAATAFLLGAVALQWPGLGNCAAATCTFGILGGYLCTQCGGHGLPVTVASLACAIVAGTLALVTRRTMTILVTSIIGGALLIVGFVGFAGTVIPTFSNTFRLFAREWPLSMPAIMVMLTTLCYAYQANQRRGDLRFGETGEVNRAAL